MAAARSALCLDCRAALARGERCDGGARHRVVRLDEPTERGRALDEVWGPPHLRARKAAAVGGTSGGTAGLLDGCGGCGELGDCGGAVGSEIGAALLVVLVVAIVAVLLWWIGSKIVHAIRRHRARLRPRGVKWRPGGPAALRGTVTAAVGVTAPVTDAACAAWGLRLRHGDALGGDLMLRDGESAGLEITLADGARVQIPAGRLRLDGTGERIDGADRHVRALDPFATAKDPFLPLAHDRGEELRLAVGDTVELLGPVEPRPDPTASAAGYREAARAVLVPVGVPWLRRVDA